MSTDERGRYDRFCADWRVLHSTMADEPGAMAIAFAASEVNRYRISLTAPGQPIAQLTARAELAERERDEALVKGRDAIVVAARQWEHERQTLAARVQELEGALQAEKAWLRSLEATGAAVPFNPGEARARLKVLEAALAAPVVQAPPATVENQDAQQLVDVKNERDRLTARVRELEGALRAASAHLSFPPVLPASSRAALEVLESALAALALGQIRRATR